MIKLIASDLDGTLLQNGDRELSGQVIDQIRRLKEMGILFAAASGRQYHSLQRLFEPVKEEIAYICENGALVVCQGRTLHKDVFPKELSREILREILKEEGAELMASGERTCYVQPKEPGFADYLRDFVGNSVTVVRDIFQVKEEFIKISVYGQQGVDEIAPAWKRKFGERATVVTSGFAWLDLMPLRADKGNGMRVLQRRFGISREDCAAFGDHYNDLEMLEQARYSFAVGEAREAVAKTAAYRTKRVETVLEEMIEKGGKWDE